MNRYNTFVPSLSHSCTIAITHARARRRWLCLCRSTTNGCVGVSRHWYQSLCMPSARISAFIGVRMRGRSGARRSMENCSTHWRPRCTNNSRRPLLQCDPSGYLCTNVWISNSLRSHRHSHADSFTERGPTRLVRTCMHGWSPGVGVVCLYVTASALNAHRSNGCFAARMSPLIGIPRLRLQCERLGQAGVRGDGDEHALTWTVLVACSKPQHGCVCLSGRPPWHMLRCPARALTNCRLTPRPKRSRRACPASSSLCHSLLEDDRHLPTSLNHSLSQPLYNPFPRTHSPPNSTQSQVSSNKEIVSESGHYKVRLHLREGRHLALHRAGSGRPHAGGTHGVSCAATPC